MNQVALISQTTQVEFSALAIVAAAIQKQVNRDVRRYWADLPESSVHAFEKLSDVPLGYWPIIIRDDIPYDAGGIHLNKANGQPYALVKYSAQWTITVSHECIEMLIDPSGNRTIAGDSVKPDQGRVIYLVEPCDPSERPNFGYSVNTVLVSDFYTPAFFDPVKTDGVKYSFTGAIRGPRQVLPGGYLSWYEPVSSHVWQLFGPNDEGGYIDRGLLPGGFESFRRFADTHSSDFREKLLHDQPSQALLLGAISGGSERVDKAATSNADSLQTQIDAFVIAPTKE